MAEDGIQSISARPIGIAADKKCLGHLATLARVVLGPVFMARAGGQMCVKGKTLEPKTTPKCGGGGGSTVVMCVYP